jgi:predicted nucleotidyltransferase
VIDARPHSSPVEALAARCGGKWPTILAAAKEAQLVRAELARRVTGSTPRLIPADTSLIVFGSLARGEWTQKSDLDWTVLVDGEVDGSHTEAARRVRKVAEELKLQEPGPTGMFGRLTFSHDLVHLIGGEDDTNTNTSRRMLLILESTEIGGDSARSVRTRVLSALLDRYVGEDLFYHAPGSYLVPRFLLNDISRYWRTMTVDSAQKRRDRGDKWALRNIKLRLSRKLIFVAGLWRCLSCAHDPTEELITARSSGDRKSVAAATTKFLLESCQKTPLETMALAFLKYEPATAAARLAFDAYEEFLTILDSESDRKTLSELDAPSAETNPTFGRAKDAAHNFQNGLSKLFFDADEGLTKDAQAYGVF